MKQRLPSFIRALLLVLGVALLLGSGPQCQAQEAVEAKGAVFNFNNVDIRSVIKSVALLTKKNFIIDPAVHGKVTIISSKPMADEEIYDIFLSILRVYNYTAIPSGQLVKIVPIDRAKTSMPADDDHPSSQGAALVTRIYQLEHIQAMQLVPILKPLMNPKGYLATHAESNSIIFIDSADNIKRLLKIIADIDQQKAANIEIVPLRYADARNIINVLKDLEPKSVKGRNMAPALKMIADERTNSILLSGAERLITRTKEMIAHLDTQVESEGSTQVVFLRHAKAEGLVPILSGIPTHKEDGGQRNPRMPKVKRRDVIVQADPETNALIITAPPAAMKTMLSVVRKLDIRRGQVLIEAVVAEVSTGKSDDLGVQWRATTDTSGSGLIGSTDFSTNERPNGGINQVAADPLKALSSGLNVGFFDGTTNILGQEIVNIGALVSALSTNSDTNILSTPSLVTLDNQEAEIVVGENLPFATGSFTSASNGNPDNPFTTFERKDVGIKLKIKPQINEGNTVRLDISQEVSKVIPSAVDTGLQSTDTRSIKTTIVVDDEKMIVLGGLISDDIQDSVFKVPLLGDIPFLGSLFKYTSSKHEKKNLMVFIRPRIIRDVAASDRVTLDKYRYIRQQQESFTPHGPVFLGDVHGPVLPDIDLTQDNTLKSDDPDLQPPVK